MSTGESPRLPGLRQELQLLEGADTVLGHRTWLVFDPVMHRYFQLDLASFRLLGLWGECRTRDELLVKARDLDGVLDADAKLAELLEFIEHNNLVEEAGNGWRRHAGNADRQRKSWMDWLLHSYLFIRIPLFRPHRFLHRTMPFVAPLFSRTFFIVIAAIGLIGAYLTVRQWEEFMATFQNFFNLEGALLYGLALVVVKVIHELAHAYTATRYGCRVPTMGVALLVMFPVLYTDVTDAWRLKSHRQRLLIAGAGMLAELTLAALATALWAFLPEGGAKSVAFVVATTSWVLSLIVNLNPLLRFDGYYLLSDALGVENLQGRSFALGRWKMREVLFNLRTRPPEALPRHLHRTLIAYAWATWVYRLFLFIGIALIVYFFFFKALGLFLFAVEIAWFIARPVWSEIKEWYAMRETIRARPRTYATIVIAAALAALAVLPIATTVEVPAILEARQSERMFPVAPARVGKVHVRAGDQVTDGQLLVELASPELDNELRIERINLRQVELRMVRLVVDKKDREQSLVLERQRRLLVDKIAGLEKRKALLSVRAPFDGRVVDVNAGLHEGRWVSREESLLTVVDDTTRQVRGYLAEADFWRVGAGAGGRFVPDDVQRDSVDVSVRDVSVANAQILDITYLASSFEGPIAVREDEEKQLTPVEAQYLVVMDPLDTMQPGMPVTRGLVRLDGKAESVLARVWRRTLQVLVRESGA